ncbi:DUF317 domain-containing protein [Streptomyces stelliscabiei]|nr:DUF317 domain-containing protein [Streptomyces stelliscabiei]MDX2553254.1 DUF317 domain-containing protein [Streptomyces stelliscabiei]MDX2612290.1 DUF317 domain-containing protein [Streptomyces stelliscabiei]MDX2637836.1 DUF317 domain-containing protein [Streptomyces stelliscabiei]MDX2667625.1 DUF317 domain-containing protein [Streptomyces stelliscabiei]MDX2718445.1 DUF317 domain-containing protein [Streptomyces stelliscabiei]
MPQRPPQAVPYVLASPGYLAGGGDWEHLTELLLRGHGWRNVSTIDQHTALASPDGRLHIILNRRADWAWTLHATTPDGQDWAVLLGAHMPVEYITAMVNALLQPPPTGDRAVLDPLRAAGWTEQATSPGASAVSPDGLVHFTEEPAHPSAPRPWRAACSVNGTGGGQPPSAPAPRPASSPRSPAASPATIRCRGWPSEHRCTAAGPTPVSPRHHTRMKTSRRCSRPGSPTSAAAASPDQAPPHRRRTPSDARRPPARGEPHPSRRRAPHHPVQEISVPRTPSRPTPPPITAERRPRLAVFLFRRYLRACIVRAPAQAHQLAGGRPEAALDESRRLGHHT